jgi:large subunit ribosomal protein L36e
MAPVQTHSSKTQATGMAMGLNRGYIVTRRAKTVRQSTKKGKLGARVALVKGVVRAVAGYAPYERRMMEILKGGGQNPTKRAFKFGKRRLGTHVRAKRKLVHMQAVITDQAREMTAISKAAEAARLAAGGAK